MAQRMNYMDSGSDYSSQSGAVYQSKNLGGQGIDGGGYTSPGSESRRSGAYSDRSHHSNQYNNMHNRSSSRATTMSTMSVESSAARLHEMSLSSQLSPRGDKPRIRVDLGIPGAGARKPYRDLDTKVNLGFKNADAMPPLREEVYKRRLQEFTQFVPKTLVLPSRTVNAKPATEAKITPHIPTSVPAKGRQASLICVDPANTIHSGSTRTESFNHLGFGKPLPQFNVSDVKLNQYTPLNLKESTVIHNKMRRGNGNITEWRT